MAKHKSPGPIREKRIQGTRYRLHFTYQGRQHKYGFIKNENLAVYLQKKVNALVEDLKYGLIAPSPGVALPDFIFGKVTGKEQDEKDSLPVIPTLSGLIKEYTELSRPPTKALSSWKAEQIHLRHLQRFVEHRGYGDPLSDTINTGFFNYYKAFRYKAGVSTDTVKKELGTFSCLFQLAVDHQYIPRNVVREVKRDKSQVPCDRFRTHDEIQNLIAGGNDTDDDAGKKIRDLKRFRYLTPPEIESLITLAKGKWMYPVLITFAYTGMRRGELPKLQWADVDLDKQFLVVRSAKQSQHRRESLRTVPIDDKLLQVLKEQKIQSGAQCWVFPGPNGGQLNVDTLRDGFLRLIKGTEFEGVGFHVFRHSLASNLAAAGVDQREIDGILGHQTEDMRKRYRHLFPANLKNAIKKLGYMK